jgi:hypothetical protein
MLKQSSLFVHGTLFLCVMACAAPGRAQTASKSACAASAVSAPHSDASRKQAVTGERRFWDRTNIALFAGVAAARALDYTSTQHFRERGNNEVLLTNGIVDNKPLFAGIEAAGVAASIAVSYWLHRTGHHRLERWVSIVHIGVAAAGDIHNYSLGRNPAAP